MRRSDAYGLPTTLPSWRSPARSVRATAVRGPARKLPAILAAVAVATLIAIAASGASTIWGLVFAVFVVVLDGIAWLTWGHASQQPSSRAAAVGLSG